MRVRVLAEVRVPPGSILPEVLQNLMSTHRAFWLRGSDAFGGFWGFQASRVIPKPKTLKG